MLHILRLLWLDKEGKMFFICIKKCYNFTITGYSCVGSDLYQFINIHLTLVTVSFLKLLKYKKIFLVFLKMKARNVYIIFCGQSNFHL